MSTASNRPIAAGWVAHSSWIRRTALAVVAITLGLHFGAAVAQGQPTIVVSAAGTLEGNAGTRVLSLPVNFIGTNSTTVAGLVSVAPLSGAGFSAATGGAACGVAGVDFERFTNVPFSIPPNTPNGSLSIGIRICSDALTEPTEHVVVTLSNVVGAVCLPESCIAVGTIGNDDGPPSMSIDNIATSEPGPFGASNALFTVTLSHPIGQQISVNFATRNGTAAAGSDYVARSGTLVIPANSPTGSIAIQILGGLAFEPAETFFVDLSSPVNATLADASGRATIRDVSLFTGAFDLSPDDAKVEVGEALIYTVGWTVPANQVWRNLKTIDMRLRGGHGTALWLRWDEASNEFSLCHKAGRDRGRADADAYADDDDKDLGSARADDAASRATCSAGALPGSAAVLATPFASLHLAATSVQGSGLTGPSVTLKLDLRFSARSAGHTYRVELTAADDFGHADRFVKASTVSVEKQHKR